MSERIAHGEMECGVASPARVEEGPSGLVLGRIVGFHAKVETEQKVGEIHAEPNAVGQSYLLPEGVEPEHTSGLVFVIVNGPDVAGINEGCALEHPE